MFISHERRLDLKTRGKDCKVYDLDNKVVKLCEACVWFDNQGYYIKPLPYIFIISDICDWYNYVVYNDSIDVDEELFYKLEEDIITIEEQLNKEKLLRKK